MLGGSEADRKLARFEEQEPDMQGEITVDRTSQQHMNYQNLFEDATASWMLN